MVTHAKFWRWLVTLLAGIMVTQVVAVGMTTAQIAGADNSGSRDLSTVVAGGSILDHVQATFTDAAGNKISSDQVTTTSKMNLVYDWSIPDNIAQAGDEFNFDLPKNFILTTGYHGDLKVADGTSIGTYVIGQSGDVNFTFNDNVRMSGIKGQLEVTSSQLQFDSLGHQNIYVPLVKDQTTNVPVNVNPNNRVDIAKAGGHQVGTSDEVDWKLGVNNMSLPMNNAVITENLPSALKLAGVEIETATANPNASNNSVSGWTGTGTKLVEGRDFELQGNTIKLIGAYANTSSPLLVTVKTKLADPDQPQQEKDLTNKVSLQWQGQDMPPTPPDASNNVHINYVPKKWLEKDFVGKGSDAHHYKWKVQYNQNSQPLAKGTTLTDTLGAGQQFITDKTSNVTLSTGVYWSGDTTLSQNTPLEKGTDYTVSYQGQQMVITLNKAMSDPLILTYDVFVADPTNGQKLENTVTDDKGHTDTDTGIVDTKPVVTKSVSGSSATDHQVRYNVDINSTNQPLNDLELTDKMTSNNATHTTANLLLDTLKLVDQTTNQTLVKGTDYTVSTSDNQFILKLIGKYAETTDHFQLTYTVGYDPTAGAETTWTNTLIGPEIETHVDWHPNPPDQTGDKTTPPYKKGIWEATDNKLRWNIVVNQAKQLINGATVTDTIDDNQIFDSVELFATYKGDDDKWKEDTPVTDFKYELSSDNKHLTVHLPDNTNTTYMVVVRTKRADPLAQITYRDTAYYNHGDAHDESNPSTIYPDNSGKIIDKTGHVDDKNGNQIDWEVPVNQSLATLTNVEITDVASANQTVDQDSLQIYPLIMGPHNYNDGAATPDMSAPLKAGTDYVVSSHVDGESGKTTTTIKFNGEIDRAYVIKYHSTLIGASGNVINDVKITADQVTQGQEKIGVSVPVSGAGVTVEGIPGTYQVHKEGPNGEKLAGAKFTLTPVAGGGAREVTTNSDGVATWKSMFTGKYYLKEVQAPVGYQISPEYQGKGKVVELTFTADQPTQSDTVINEKAILPHTGGWQRAIALLIGTMLLSLAGWLIVSRMQKAGEVS